MTRFPEGLTPMKAVTGVLPPDDDDGWAFEIKWDGMRLLAYCDPGEATPLRLQTTRGHDAVPRWPELGGLGDALGCPAILDGEVVVLEPDGRSDFGRLQRREGPATFMVFDLLWLDGNEVMALPYLDRRRLLLDLVDDDEAWRVSPHHLGDGRALYESAEARGLEGLMAKRVDSRYEPGKRTPNWRKVKVRRRQELVVGGWLPGEGNRTGTLGALLVGYHDETGLRYAGRVGTGFNARELKRLEGRLAELASGTSPFVDEPPVAVRNRAHWIRPEMVAEVEFGEWTVDGILRHPAYIGERTDKDPADVIREPDPGS